MDNTTNTLAEQSKLRRLCAYQAAKTPVSYDTGAFAIGGEGGNQRSQADRLTVLLRFRSLGGDSEYKFIIHIQY